MIHVLKTNSRAYFVLIVYFGILVTLAIFNRDIPDQMPSSTTLQGIIDYQFLGDPGSFATGRIGYRQKRLDSTQE